MKTCGLILLLRLQIGLSTLPLSLFRSHFAILSSSSVLHNHAFITALLIMQR